MPELDDILKKALEGNALKTVSLVNLTFTIHSTGDIHSNVIPGKEGKDDKTTYSYRATISLDGEDEKKEAWLGGGFLTPQITALVNNNLIPSRVKLIMDASKDGNPYILVAPTSTAPVAAPAETSSNGSQSPQEMAQHLFAVSAMPDAAKLDIASQCGVGVQYSADGKLMLEASMLEVPQAVKLIERLR